MGNTLLPAYLKPEAVNSRKFILHDSDLEEMAGDTLRQHAFADSLGPASSPDGAYGPSWSPDGGAIAYEIGWENLTTRTSRVYWQPIAGPRRDGPTYPSTNPRYWTDGKDTALVWCTSGREDAWADSATAIATYGQKVAGGALAMTGGGLGERLARFLSRTQGAEFRSTGSAWGTYLPDDKWFLQSPQWALNNLGGAFGERPGKAGVDINIAKATGTVRRYGRKSP